MNWYKRNKTSDSQTQNGIDGKAIQGFCDLDTENIDNEATI
jgi:hypothetical protein